VVFLVDLYHIIKYWMCSLKTWVAPVLQEVCFLVKPQPFDLKVKLVLEKSASRWVVLVLLSDVFRFFWWNKLIHLMRKKSSFLPSWRIWQHSALSWSMCV